MMNKEEALKIAKEACREILGSIDYIEQEHRISIDYSFVINVCDFSFSEVQLMGE